MAASHHTQAAPHGRGGKQSAKLAMPPVTLPLACFAKAETGAGNSWWLRATCSAAATLPPSLCAFIDSQLGGITTLRNGEVERDETTSDTVD